MSVLTKIVAATAALGLLAPIAFAEGLSVTGSATVGVGVQTSRGTTTVQGSANTNASQGSSTRASTTTAARLENQSAVSVQVQALLSAADRDGGIGAEVRDVAHLYASSSARASKEMQNVEKRPGWLTVLIGANYKSLGALRSEVATTQNAINRLEAARDRATDASIKAALDVQIQALIASASSTKAYIKAHEDVFSVFGWFFKLFS